MNNKKTIIILILVLTIGIVGLTIAYFANSTSVDNQFTTQPYGTTVEESFISPSNWLPGDTTTKTITATNSGNVDEAVRISFTEGWTPANNDTLNGWIHTDGTKSTHSTENELATDERVALINFTNPSDWTKVGDYYYYNYKLAPQESTSTLIDSVTFNSKTKLDDTCVTTTNGSIKTITCNSNGSNYDNATYTLTFNIETVQYNKYQEAWGTNVALLDEKPQEVNFAQHIISKSNAVTITNYTDGVTTEAYTFEHESTVQTPDLTDYRYIGPTPNNYVEFNCDDNSENCEIWRAIGVFNVDDGDDNWEWRVKLVRGSALAQTIAWNSNDINDWSNASLKDYLNGDYYNGLVSNGLSETSRAMTDDVIFYLGGPILNDHLITYFDAENQYKYERGNYVFNHNDYCIGNSFDKSRCEANYCINNPEDNYCHTSPIFWKGKIGLLYPSDEYMVYGNGVDDNCYNNAFNCTSDYAKKGWVYNSNILDGGSSPTYTWLLTPYTDAPNIVGVGKSGGYLEYNFGVDVTYNGFAVRPTLYLSSSVKIIDGDGSINNPYKLGL